MQDKEANKNISIFSKILIATERMKELKEKRYGNMATGVFDPAVNKSLPRLVDQMTDELNDGKLGEEYLVRYFSQRIKRSNGRRKQYSIK